jgi:alpha-tubulin suppressor-like RCC1 family protein
MYHSLALSDIGDIYSWGRGFEGQLGLLESTESISSPQYIPHFFKYDKTRDIKLLHKTPIHAIACGAYHSIAIDHNNQIYCWGEARYGQTGAGKKTKQPIPTKLDISVEVNINLFRGNQER